MSKDELERAWQALELAPSDMRAKQLISRSLQAQPELISPKRKADLERLLSDPDVGPHTLAAAGWILLARNGALSSNAEVTATLLEQEPLALRLLNEACVTSLDAELALNQVRRWLLLSGSRQAYPRLAKALVAQAAINGGAWPFDEDERAALDRAAGSFAAAYLPDYPAPPPQNAFADPVTRDVAEQYRRWPYPIWSRITPPDPATLPRYVEKLDGGRASRLPTKAQILVAGCGTGREAALIARRFPDAKVTAIDLSATSLAYAATHCVGLGVDFRVLDLHEIASLDRRFDLIACSGVLHHLADPEAGWAKLMEVLTPGGVMKVMVYSRLARLPIEAAKIHIADLLGGTVDDDLLRAARHRLINRCPNFVSGFADFYSLGGTHDLLLNAHEDPFDIPRIARALGQLRLELLAFKLPTAMEEAEYRRDNRHDPMFRDLEALAEFEQARPFLFSSMYEVWCRKAA